MGVVFAQSQFQLAVGGTSDDAAYSIIQTSDGGYAAAGITASFGGGGFHMYVVKLNSSGTLQWSNAIGGTNDDIAFSIIQTTDGGYAVAGSTNSFGAGGKDIYILKLNDSGMLLWSKTIGGINDDEAYSIVQTVDGGYAVAGYTTSFGAGSYDFYIVKLDASGTPLWSKTIGGTDIDFANSIIQTTDGGYAVAGYTLSFGAGSADAYIVKLDASGTLQWSRTVGGTDIDLAFSIIQTTDNGYAVAGLTSSFGAGGHDAYILKIDPSGTLQWSKTVGGTGDDYGFSIIQTTDGGYGVAGETYSFGMGLEDFFIVKLDASGMLQWSRTVGGKGGDVARSIIQTKDGGYAVGGETYSFGAGLWDLYIVKLDASGNTCGNSTSPISTITSPASTVTTPTPIVTTPSSTVTIPPTTVTPGGTPTTMCVLGIHPISNEIPDSYELYQNYPNPFNPTTEIKFDLPKPEDVKIVLYNTLGQQSAVLVDGHYAAGSYSVQWNASNYPSGVYFYRITAGSFTDVKKMVLLK